MKAETPVDLVCFDLGGVLIRICWSWAEACRTAGLPVPDASAQGLERHRSLTTLLDTGRISYDEWASGVSAAFGGLYSPDDAKCAHDAISQEEMAGALALVDALHSAGVVTACLSNTNPAHWARLVHHDGVRPRPGAPEYPAVVRLKRHFASHILGAMKPDPAIYAAFERLTGARGEGIVFFDDRAENVEAACRREWRAHQIDPERDPIAQVRAHLHRYGVLEAAPSR
jgi:FMN phosphatase YigB (HAD superfamily)